LVELYVSWQNDPIVMRGEGRVEHETVEGRAAGLEAQLKGHHAHFTVYDLTGDVPVPIGTTSLIIDRVVRCAEFLIALGPQGRGRGFATPVTKLALHHAFDVAGLRNVILHVLEPNEAGVRAYRRAGFQTIGRRRDSGYWNAEPCDEIIMDAVPADLVASATEAAKP
jgi:RimJ/RimL family protein N-acetyltransferase